MTRDRTDPQEDDWMRAQLEAYLAERPAATYHGERAKLARVMTEVAHSGYAVTAWLRACFGWESPGRGTEMPAVLVLEERLWAARTERLGQALPAYEKPTRKRRNRKRVDGD